MLNKNVATLLTVLGVMSSSALATPAKAEGEYYLDSASISEWALPHVNSLTIEGCYVGTTANTFMPQQPISREELAVVLHKCIQAERTKNDISIADLKDLLQKKDSELKAAIEAAKPPVEKEKTNWVGVSIGISTDEAQSVVSLDSKVQIVKLTDKIALSIRPAINTASEISATLTADYKVSDKLGLYLGAGAATRLDSDRKGLLTAGDEETVALAEVGVEYKLNKNLGAYLETEVPLVDDSEPVVKAGFNLAF